MGLILQDVMGIMPLVGGLYGSLGLFTGWTAHLVHGVVVGLVYAAVVNYTSLRRYADGTVSGAVLGVAYGVVVWVVAAAFVMPIWLQTVLMDPPPVPTFEPMSLLAHVVFGVVLGAAYAVARNR